MTMPGSVAILLEAGVSIETLVKLGIITAAAGALLLHQQEIAADVAKAYELMRAEAEDFYGFNPDPCDVWEMLLEQWDYEFDQELNLLDEAWKEYNKDPCNKIKQNVLKDVTKRTNWFKDMLKEMRSKMKADGC